MKKIKGGYCGVLWNLNVERTGKEKDFIFILPSDKKEYCLITHTVDEKNCNPLKLWHDMGEPKTPLEEQKDILRHAAQPIINSDIIMTRENEARFSIRLSEYGVVYFELTPRSTESDRGYNYKEAVK